MATEGLAAVGLRNAFYKDNYRRVTAVLFISILINIILAGILFFLITHPPMPKYFATTINGRITDLVPIDQPNQSDSAVLQWANQAAIAAFTYNFVNYREELQASSGFFTPSGWHEFLRALNNSNNLQAVTEKRLIVSAVATRAPIILEKGRLNGVYSWRVQMPVLVTYQSASEFSQQNNIVTVLIQRISTLNSPRGIGISQFIVAPGSTLGVAATNR